MQKWPIRPELIPVSDYESPGWDASPLQGYPAALNSPVPIYTPGCRARTQTARSPRSGPLDAESGSLTMRPLSLTYNWDN